MAGERPSREIALDILAPTCIPGASAVIDQIATALDAARNEGRREVGPCPVHSPAILDYHTLDTPTAADLLRAARWAEEIGAMLVIDGQRLEAMTLAALRSEDAACGYRAADAIRDLAASLVPTPEEARPMNRAQRRARGGDET